MMRLRLVALLLLAPLAVSPAVYAQGALAQGAVAPGGKVPARWAAYAAQVGQRLQMRLADDQDPVATRLHMFLDARAASLVESPAAPVLRLWFNEAGKVSRVTFSSLGDAQADQDLRQLIVSQSFGAPPPNMRQPLVLQLSLAFPS